MFITKVIILFLLPTAFNERLEWIQHLTNNIETEVKLVNQIIILQSANETHGKSQIEDVLFGILIKFPSRIISFQWQSVQDQLSKLQIGDPQTALFVLLHYQNTDQDFSPLSESINFVSNISKSRSRPKCLIISLENEKFGKYRKLLRQMWSHDFLDVTVVSILSIKNNSKSEMNAMNFHAHKLTGSYYYNPHRNVTTKIRKLKSQLFPDKARNLNKYPINVHVMNYPPETFLPSNISETNKISGIGWLKMKTLENAMNFKIFIYPLKNYTSKIDCTGKKNPTGFYLDLQKRKFEFISTEFQKYGRCNKIFSESAIGLVNTKVVLVVPILYKKSYILSDMWAIFRLFSMASFPFIIWLFLRLSRNQSANLPVMYLIQIMLGSSIPQVPQKTKGRFIFAALIISCTLCSTTIYTSLTDVGLHKQTKYSFETINDVLLSNITIVVHENIATTIQTIVTGKSQLLLEKGLKIIYSNAGPVEQVYVTKNITCITFSTYAKFILQDKRDRCGMPMAKILESEEIAPTISYTPMAFRSPYVRRVNILLQRLIQSGITEKWKHSYDKKLPKNAASLDFSCFNRSIELEEIYWKLFFIIIIGYSLSIFTFFMEIFILYRLKYIAKHFKVGKYLQTRAGLNN